MFGSILGGIGKALGVGMGGGKKAGGVGAALGSVIGKRAPATAAPSPGGEGTVDVSGGPRGPADGGRSFHKRYTNRRVLSRAIRGRR